MRTVNSIVAGRPILIVVICTIVTALFLIFITCSKDSGTGPDRPKPTIRLVSQTECKSTGATSQASGALGCTSDCLRAWMDSVGNLHVRHINAGLSCCLESLTVSFSVVGDVILITPTEFEPQTLCRCLCLYDVEYEIANPPTGQYKIEVVEQATVSPSPDLPLCCSVLLPLKDTTGCCVERCHYPWATTPTPTVRVVHVSPCKNMGAAAATDTSTQCAEWSYGLDHTLALKHIDAVFNCCHDSVTTQIELFGDSLVITETEHVTNGCSCVCPFDVDLVVNDLPPGIYHLSIKSSNWLPVLSWTVDLVQQATGSYCLQ